MKITLVENGGESPRSTKSDGGKVFFGGEVVRLWVQDDD